MSNMWKYEIERDQNTCRINLYPDVKDLRIGGYGYRDVIVYKGAPVSFKSIAENLMKINKIEYANLSIEEDHLVLIVEVKGDFNCEDLIKEILNRITDILISAERDLTKLEEVMIESARRYAEKERMKKESKNV